LVGSLPGDGRPRLEVMTKPGRRRYAHGNEHGFAAKILMYLFLKGNLLIGRNEIYQPAEMKTAA
jgi:hypothetical protein